MNILIVTSEFGQEGGGLALSCSKIADILSTSYQVRILSSSYYPIYTAEGGYKPQLYEAINKEYKLKEDVLNNKDIDIILGFGGGLNGYYASLLAERLHKKFVLTLRGSDVNLSKWSVEDNWFLLEACQRAEKIICLSHEMASNVISSCPIAIGKTIIIPNYLTGNLHNITFPNLPDKLIVGCAATHLNEKKGVGNLIQMISEFRKLYKFPIFLVLIGHIDDTLMTQYKHLAKKLKVEDCVVYEGYLSRKDTCQVISKWDFYIQGSVCEGHPNAISESMESGTGFISTRTGYVAELLKDNYPEFFFSSYNPSVMAKELCKLVKMEDKGKKYKEAYSLIVSNCKKEDISGRWKSIFNNYFIPTHVIPSYSILAVGLHDIKGECHDSITTPVNVFKKFVDFIYKSGFGLCSMRNYISKNVYERRKYIVCTFDDGYDSLEKEAFEILSAYGFTATVFVCTGLIGKDNSWNNKDASLRKHLDLDGLKKLNNFGWEIASHGVLHKNMLKLSDLEIESELINSQKFLLDTFGYSDSYAYPYGAYNKFIEKSVSKYYKFAFAVDKGGTSLLADCYQIRRYSITELYKILGNEENNRYL